jgi:membrane protease YdiL (CAAX protease family)
MNKRSAIFSIAIVAGLIFALARAIGTIGPPFLRFVLPIGFIAMVLMPFIFLNKVGRKRIGLTKSISLKYYFLAIVAGAVLALICFGTGLLFFGTSPNNWFVSIKNTYINTFDTTGLSTISIFITFTMPAIIFSPFGEEIFFRGFLQEALSERFSYNKAVYLDALFFALIHLFHHGIVKDIAGAMHFYPWSGLLWVLLMFTTALVFAWVKKKSGSLFPAIVAHIIFNLVMNVTIFYGM